MNAEQLLAHFEWISEAPDAITRLRRFILDPGGAREAGGAGSGG